MANEDKKDFNAMLHDSKDMPKFQTITDEKSIEKYGGDKMYFAPPIEYDKIMRLVPYGKLLTVGTIRDYFAKQSGADFTEPITAGIFVSIVAWASYQRSEDETPYWRTLKANGELNAKYPGGVEAQKEKLETEGHTIVQKGRKNIRYYVKDYENALFALQAFSGKGEQEMNEIKSVSDYVDYLDTMKETYPMQRYVVPATFFRGQSNKESKLSPRLYR